MKLKMIREAQTLSTISEKGLEIAKAAKQVLGKETISETMDSLSGDISRADYNKWMSNIQWLAKKRKINLNTRRNFENVAFEMLDNDPKMDLATDPERLRRQVVATLWASFQASQTHEKASRMVQRGAAKKAKEEEELFKSMVSGSLQPRSVEDEEAPKGNPVEMSACSAAKKDFECKTPMRSKCPYTKGTFRADMWREFYKNAMDGLMYPKAQENEEEPVDQEVSATDLAKADMEGFQAFIDTQDGREEELPADDVEMDVDDHVAAAGNEMDDELPADDMDMEIDMDRAREEEEMMQDEMTDELPPADDMEMDDHVPVDDEVGSEQPVEDTPNPYEPGTEQHDAWMAGWQRAQEYFNGSAGSEEVDAVDPEMDPETSPSDMELDDELDRKEFEDNEVSYDRWR